MSAKPLIPRLSSTILVLARAPASAFSVAGNLYKVLFIQRARSSGFMANAHVFPGGLLDPADEAPVWSDASAGISAPVAAAPAPGSFPIRSDKRDSIALRVGALRELFEETGLLLARPASAAAGAPAVAATPASPYFSHAHSFPSLESQRAAQQASSANASSLAQLLQQQRLRLEAQKLAPWSRWITPVFEKRRYDTLFYLAALPEPFTALSGDPGEVASTLWLSPVEALEMARQRQIVLPPPTTYILRELQLVRTIEEVFAQVSARSLPALLPRRLPADAVPAAAAMGADAAPLLHMALPDDPCYPLDDAGTLPEQARSPAVQSQSDAWHRMVRSPDGLTRIYRPASMHLRPSPPVGQAAKL